jgi:hypothetical protein
MQCMNWTSRYTLTTNCFFIGKHGHLYCVFVCYSGRSPHNQNCLGGLHLGEIELGKVVAIRLAN